MADPRVVDFTGLAPKTATFKIDGSTITYDVTKVNGSAQVGLAVTLSTDGTVALAGDGEAVIGKLLKVEKDGAATVQYGGFVTLPAGNGASLTIGKKIVGAVNASSAKGYIREVATATAAELGVCRGAVIDNELHYARVSEGGEIPRARLVGGEKTMRIYKFGRALETSYEQLRRMRINRVAMHIALLAAQTEVDKVGLALDTLINGDGNPNTAA